MPYITQLVDRDDGSPQVQQQPFVVIRTMCPVHFSALKNVSSKVDS